MKIAINGFGRIGRNFLRAVLLDPQSARKLQVVAINIGPGKPDCVAHMFKYDTLMGIYPGNIRVQDGNLCIDDYIIKIFTESDPARIPWAASGVEWVVEASGCFTHKKDASKHIVAGARHVLITAPAKEEDISIVPGVNEQLFDSKKHTIVSMGSCTTNAFVTLLKVLHDAFIITGGFMTTVHAYTNTQVLLDVGDDDMRRCRAAALNIIPTSTGASEVVVKVMPELNGIIKAVALRVPVAKVSLIDFTFTAQKLFTVETIHAALLHAKNNRMRGILDLTIEPLVSSDFSGNNYSVVIDGLLTEVNGTLGKVFGWYDNEWGYSVRLKDFLLYVAGEFSNSY
ncbi:MAG: type I glyceraldehyde-3-phosphate dehydrogenase [Candidatus Dependentiae bacterium]|nr:type I glyceraldehyde-3-phosphate dehydrogenase [Candidatus Dependentiae bacterium]